MVREGRGLTTLWSSHVLLPLIGTAGGHGCIANGLPSLVRGMVQQRTDVVYEQRVKHLGDLLLVGEVQRAIEGNPAAVSVAHQKGRDPLTKHL